MARKFRCCHCNETVLKVHNLSDLAELAESRKSVFVPDSYVYRKPRPAAWIINLNGALLLSLIRKGLYQYEPKYKRAEKES